MLPPEVAEEAGIAVVAIPDVDTIEARMARVESMVADIHGTVTKIGPIVTAVSTEMAEKGPVGMMGYLLAAVKGS